MLIAVWLARSSLVKYHRILEDYFPALQHVGFVVNSVRESHPERKWFTEEKTYERRNGIPLFLFLAASKAG
jgi:hypothetical protein